MVRYLLGENPNSYYWRTFMADALHHFLHEQGLHCGPITAQRVFDLAHEALLPPEHLAEALAERLKNDFQHFIQLDARLTELQQQAEMLVPQSLAAVLTTVPGIGAYLAAQYLAFVGDPHRFNHADQIWSLAGFDVEQDDSRDRRRMCRITRRGDPAFRYVLFAIGLNTSQYCPPHCQSETTCLTAWQETYWGGDSCCPQGQPDVFLPPLHQVAYDPKLAR